MIEAVLSNKGHPEYGRITLSFPIPRDEYGRCIELVERMEIGDASKQDSFTATRPTTKRRTAMPWNSPRRTTGVSMTCF